MMSDVTRMLLIQVIPEFDMPGHAHAAIAAMKARYHVTNDTTYLLSDLSDSSQYKYVAFSCDFSSP